MRPGITPAPGDVVVSAVAGPPPTFALGIANGSPQVVGLTYEQAVRQARQFGAHVRVDVWVVEDDGVSLVARHRTDTTARGRGERGRER
jgi:hypothetical protein